MQHAKHRDREIIDMSNHHRFWFRFFLVLKWVHHRPGQMVCTHAEESFIDAEYEKFKEIRKQFSTKTKVAELAQEKRVYRMPSAAR